MQPITWAMSVAGAFQSGQGIGATEGVEQTERIRGGQAACAQEGVRDPRRTQRVEDALQIGEGKASRSEEGVGVSGGAQRGQEIELLQGVQPSQGIGYARGVAATAVAGTSLAEPVVRARVQEGEQEEQQQERRCDGLPGKT